MSSTDATDSPDLDGPTPYPYAGIGLRPPAVLLVEDDLRLRRLLRHILEEEGYLVAEADSAERGLALLGEGCYDAILADYQLPKASGAWMLAEAASQGLLGGVPSFIVTGETTANNDAFDVIPKPIDFEGLLATLRLAVSGEPNGHRRGARKAGRPASHRAAHDGKGANGRTPIELVLYISSSSIHSATALRNIQNVLEAYDGPPVKLVVHDLAKDPHVRDTHNVLFTPALLSPGPNRRTWIVGNLQNPRVILELLDDAAERA